jgi:hypothetical protein
VARRAIGSVVKKQELEGEDAFEAPEEPERVEPTPGT